MVRLTECLSRTEEEGRQLPRRRPEGHRSGSPGQHQEGAIPRQLPRHQLLPPEGRQAPRDALVDGRTVEGGVLCGYGLHHRLKRLAAMNVQLHNVL